MSAGGPSRRADGASACESARSAESASTESMPDGSRELISMCGGRARSSAEKARRLRGSRAPCSRMKSSRRATSASRAAASASAASRAEVA
eukprot:scaffold55710_cov25-Tisochrysis_lutea.AAC.2